MQPVPAPTVRDLSVAQPSKGARSKKPAQPEPVRELGPAEVVEVIPAREVAAATVGDILGKKAEPAEKSDEAKADASPDEQAAEAKPEPEVHISGLPTRQSRRPKPITVASTPMIGNYQLPPLDFLQQPDLTIKPPSRKRN